jgi:hypothetical protein
LPAPAPEEPASRSAGKLDPVVRARPPAQAGGFSVPSDGFRPGTLGGEVTCRTALSNCLRSGIRLAVRACNRRLRYARMAADLGGHTAKAKENDSAACMICATALGANSHHSTAIPSLDSRTIYAATATNPCAGRADHDQITWTPDRTRATKGVAIQAPLRLIFVSRPSRIAERLSRCVRIGISTGIRFPHRCSITHSQRRRRLPLAQ